MVDEIPTTDPTDSQARKILDAMLSAVGMIVGMDNEIGRDALAIERQLDAIGEAAVLRAGRT